MATYAYDISHIGNVYRPPWEPAEDPAAQLVGYNTVGAAPQWGDGSDATYSDLLHRRVQTSPEYWETARIRPTVDFAAHPDVDVINTITLRAEQLDFGPNGWRADVRVKAFDLRTERAVWTGAEKTLASVGVNEVVWALTAAELSVALPLLQEGHLAITAQIWASERLGDDSNEHVTVRAYGLRLGIESETPPPTTATARYRRYCRRFPRE